MGPEVVGVQLGVRGARRSDTNTAAQAQVVRAAVDLGTVAPRTTRTRPTSSWTSRDLLRTPSASGVGDAARGVPGPVAEAP